MKFEYKALCCSNIGVDFNKFNQLGSQGWEMYCVLEIKNDRIYYFKRKISRWFIFKSLIKDILTYDKQKRKAQRKP